MPLYGDGRSGTLNVTPGMYGGYVSAPHPPDALYPVAKAQVVGQSTAPADSYGQVVFNDQPVGWWRGDGSSVDARAGVDGVLTNGATYGAAVLPANPSAQSFSLDGVDDFVAMANATSVRVGDPITVEAWVVPATVSAGFHAVAGSVNYLIERNGANFTVFTQGTGTLTGSTTIVAGNVYHVVATWSGTTVTLYVNGAVDVTGTFSTSPGAASNGFRIGSYDGTSEFWPGRVAEVALYNRALTSGQVSAHYTAGSAGGATPATAVGSITLDGAAGSASALPTAAGSITLSGAPTARAAVTAAGSVSLSGAVSAPAASTSSAGAVTLAGTTAATATASATSGGIALSGTTSATARPAASGVITLSGTATGSTPGVNTAAGSITLGGSVTAFATPTATGTITLGGTVTARVPATAAGLITLSGLANSSSGVADTYFPHVPVTAAISPADGTAVLAASTLGTATITQTAAQGFGTVPFGSGPFGGATDTTGTSTVTPAPAMTATLAGNGQSTAVLAGNGVGTAELILDNETAVLQLT